MKTSPSALASLSDTDLIAEVKLLAAHERQATAEFVASLGELDARRLYLSAGCSSTFSYCTQVLGYSEDAAYFRIEAARAARRGCGRRHKRWSAAFAPKLEIAPRVPRSESAVSEAAASSLDARQRGS